MQIKESSLYYHFPSKQAILDTLIGAFEETANRMMDRLHTAIKEQTTPIQGPFYQGACDAFFEEYLMDPFCNRVMRLLAIERFCNATIGELHNRWLLVEPILFQREVFFRPDGGRGPSRGTTATTWRCGTARPSISLPSDGCSAAP